MDVANASILAIVIESGSGPYRTVQNDLFAFCDTVACPLEPRRQTAHLQIALPDANNYVSRGLPGAHPEGATAATHSNQHAPHNPPVRSIILCS